VLVSEGVAQEKDPSASERKNCVAVPLPVTANLSAVTLSEAILAVVTAPAAISPAIILPDFTSSKADPLYTLNKELVVSYQTSPVVGEAGVVELLLLLFIADSALLISDLVAGND
jgi:hypothetical protein